MPRICWVVLSLVATVAACAHHAPPTVQTPPPDPAASLGLHAYPASGQAPALQQKDERACYSWAQQNTGFDPLAPSPGAASSGRPPAARGAAKGAAVGAVTGSVSRGAALGAATGAVVGRSRGTSDQQQEQQAQIEQQQFEGFRRSFTACLDGRGYSVL
jgi:hypothetical protein